MKTKNIERRMQKMCMCCQMSKSWGEKGMCDVSFVHPKIR